MNTAFPPCPNPREWRVLYRVAILETNKSLLPQRVSEAEKAVIERARQLSYDHGASEEEDALEDALYALRAFRSSWQHGEAA